MIRLLLMLCGLAETFLVWFLVALIRESRHGASRTELRSRVIGAGERSGKGADGAECIALMK
jgi:hypothetical protein